MNRRCSIEFARAKRRNLLIIAIRSITPIPFLKTKHLNMPTGGFTSNPGAWPMFSASGRSALQVVSSLSAPATRSRKLHRSRSCKPPSQYLSRRSDILKKAADGPMQVGDSSWLELSPSSALPERWKASDPPPNPFIFTLHASRTTPFSCNLSPSPYYPHRMITALLLIFDSSATWEKIGTRQNHSVWRVFLSYLLPLMLLSIAGESLGLLKFGMWEGDILPRLVKPSQELVIRYETV